MRSVRARDRSKRSEDRSKSRHTVGSTRKGLNCTTSMESRFISGAEALTHGYGHCHLTGSPRPSPCASPVYLPTWLIPDFNSSRISESIVWPCYVNTPVRGSVGFVPRSKGMDTNRPSRGWPRQPAEMSLGRRTLIHFILYHS